MAEFLQRFKSSFYKKIVLLIPFPAQSIRQYQGKHDDICNSLIFQVNIEIFSCGASAKSSKQKKNPKSPTIKISYRMSE